MVTTMKTSTMLIFGLLSAAALGQSYGDPTRTDLGVGAATLGIANNAVASANDLSALLWNPAGLSTGKSCSRLQFSLGGQRPSSRSSLDPAGVDPAPEVQNTRIRFGNIGYAVTSGRRGRRMAVGFAYQNPYSLDAMLDYTGTAMVGADQVSFRNQYLALGGLDFWTAGGSMELAPGFYAGGALSLVTGRSVEEVRFEQLTNGRIKDPRTDSYHIASERRYGGYDARLGIVMRAGDILALGMRMELPAIIGFTETGIQTNPSNPSSRQTYVVDGYLRSYYSGAIGVAMRLPLVRVSSELTARAPLPRESLSDPQGYWKIGMGAGAEMDFLPGFVTGRAGYAWREYDPNPYQVIYRDPVSFDPASKARSSAGEHTVSLGASINFSDRVSLDGAYAHRLLRTRTADALRELNQSHQALASVAFRF